MALAGTIFVVVIFTVFIGLIVWANASGSKRDGGVRTTQYLNAKTGYEVYLEYPTGAKSVVQRDPQNKLDYVDREKGIFDKGDQRIDLSENYELLHFKNYDMLIDNTDVFAEMIAEEKQRWRKKYLVEKGEHDKTKVDLQKYQNLFGREFKKHTRRLGEMRDSALPYFDLSKNKKKGGR